MLFALLAVYVAFLNPHEVQFHLTQSVTFHLPMAVLSLTAVLVGVVATSLLHWTVGIRNFFSRTGENFSSRRREKQLAKVESLYQKGENSFAGKRLDKASRFFEKILVLHPQHIGALYHQGMIMRIEKDFSRALELHLRAAELAPGNLKILYSLAEDYSAAKAYEKEMAILEKIQKIDKHSSTPLEKMRDVCLNMEDWNGASAFQKKIIPLLPHKEDREKAIKRLSQLIYSNGIRLSQNSNSEAAIPEFKRAIRENKHCLPAYVALGDLYQKIDNIKTAIKIWKEGFENTRSPVCLMRIQKAYQESKNSEAVIKIFKEAIRSSKNAKKEVLVMMLGTLLLDNGRPEEAIQELEAIQPTTSLLHALLTTWAHQEKQEAGVVGKTPAFDLARESILQFTCDECHTSVQEWVGQCPVCSGWDCISPSLH